MRSMMKKLVLSAFLVEGMAQVIGATDLYWQGDDSATTTWNGEAKVWKVNNEGEDVSWASKGEPKTAYFASAAKFAIAGPAPRSIVVDSAGLVWLSLSTAHSWNGAFNALTSLVKKGSGTFEIRCGTGSLAGTVIGNQSDAVLDLQAGTLLLNLEAGTNDNGDPRKFLGGSLVRIGQDATFDAKVKAGIGLEDGYLPSVELNGGRFNVYSQSSKNRFNELAYNGGDVSLLRNAWTTPNPVGEGDLTIMGKLTVTGSVARTLSVAADPSFSSNGGSVCFNPLAPARTEVCVSNVTGDAAADLTVLAGGATFSTTNGFIKTGDGKVCFANPWKSFSGPVSVDEGTLILDGQAKSSAPDVTVAAGAFIGGTGSVKSVTFAAGSGLAVKVGQAGPLQVTDAVVLPANGSLDVSCDGAVPESLRILVIRSETATSGDFAGWTIRLNGQETDKIRLRIYGETLVACGVTDLYWQKDDTKTWTWTANDAYWKVNNKGEDVSWASTDDPRRANFTSAAKFAIAGPEPGSIVVDSSDLVWLSLSAVHSWDNAFGALTSLVKKGSGTFEIRCGSGALAGTGIGNRSDAVWDLQGGTFLLNLEAPNNDSGKPSQFLGRSLVRVAVNATFDVKVRPGIGLESGYWPSVELNGGNLNIYGQYGQNRFDSIVYNGGNVSLNLEKWDGTWGNGDLTIMGSLIVTGTVARTLSVAVDPALATSGVCLNPLTRTEFCVSNVTGDAAVDLTLAAEGASYTTTNGLRKTGGGTLRVANCWKKFSGDVTVNEGTLIIDSTSAADGSSPDVTLADNAFLGGTGTVQSVTFGTGTGFAVAEGRKGPLTVKGAVTLPTTCLVDVTSAEDRPERLNIAVIRSETGLTGDVTGWTVRLNGEPTDYLVLKKVGNTVKVLRESGLIMVVR